MDSQPIRNVNMNDVVFFKVMGCCAVINAGMAIDPVYGLHSQTLYKKIDCYVTFQVNASQL